MFDIVVRQIRVAHQLMCALCEGTCIGSYLRCRVCINTFHCQCLFERGYMHNQIVALPRLGKQDWSCPECVGGRHVRVSHVGPACLSLSLSVCLSRFSEISRGCFNTTKSVISSSISNRSTAIKVERSFSLVCRFVVMFRLFRRSHRSQRLRHVSSRNNVRRTLERVDQRTVQRTRQAVPGDRRERHGKHRLVRFRSFLYVQVPRQQESSKSDGPSSSSSSSFRSDASDEPFDRERISRRQGAVRQRSSSSSRCRWTHDHWQVASSTCHRRTDCRAQVDRLGANRRAVISLSLFLSFSLSCIGRSTAVSFSTLFFTISTCITTTSSERHLSAGRVLSSFVSFEEILRVRLGRVSSTNSSSHSIESFELRCHVERVAANVIDGLDLPEGHRIESSSAGQQPTEKHESSVRLAIGRAHRRRHLP
jgi:hypothetical protein